MKDEKKIVLIISGVVVGVLAFELIKANGARAVSLVNPADENNIVNQGTNKIVKTVSGGQFLSLGDFLFTLFNPNAPGEAVIGRYGVGRREKL